MKKLSYFIILLLFIASCKKYEEGPDFTLRTIYNRLKGEWEITNVYISGIDSTQIKEFDYIELILCNEGSICVPIWDQIYNEQKKTIYFKNINREKLYKGWWIMDNFKKINIGGTLIAGGDIFRNTYVIKKLTKEQMILIDNNNSNIRIELIKVKKS